MFYPGWNNVAENVRRSFFSRSDIVAYVANDKESVILINFKKRHQMYIKRD